VRAIIDFLSPHGFPEVLKYPFSQSKFYLPREHQIIYIVFCVAFFPLATTIGSYQSQKATIYSIYLQQNLERILVINGSKFAGGNDLIIETNYSNTLYICKHYPNVNKTVTLWNDTIHDQVCILIK
jgi:hypothetical protein